MFEAVQTYAFQPIPLPVPKQIRALLLDDSQFDRQRIRRLSHKSDLPIVLEEVDSLQDMYQALRGGQFDVMLLDYRLPVGSGIDALSVINQDPRHRHAAKIMITGAGEVDVAVQAMQEGCHDYLNKDALDVPTLHKSLTQAIAVSRQNQKAEQDHREVFRHGLTTALKDQSVQAALAQMVRSELSFQQSQTSAMQARFSSPQERSALDAMIVEFLQPEDEDEFRFH